ncbi:hypothetical protein [Sphingobium sp. Ant17]|uniref:hypothetical protein n=1 Tax=Sphingobium sp. Ant17 TaxID=1461752 RepID=UPI0004B6DE6F|nr:hypothetical protein [Sphingobium sp. Ant17]OHC91500.1 MAG: hypothetical protein A2095_02520 [Sphingomonadales bacterium GWF1_63_6]|tara:strand:+ start:2390 stop:3259 length:870 start_codon:yes stop_codon:yes gene_type:complete
MHDADGDRSIPATPPPARRWSILPLATLVLLAFVIGVALTVWAWPKIQQRWNGQSTRPVAAMPQAGTPSPAIAPNAMSASSAQMLDARVAALDERLTRITVEAQAASGNAARAEGLLIAFAARRALDNGGSLGYIEAQLRSRFGQAQPRAVATIINAAREPVTLADLRVGLTDLGDQLTTPPVESDWWDAIAHEARELVTIRKASAPSPRPQAALERAVRYLDGGRVSAALAEIERMPGRAAADRWLQFARRYLEARRALDLIETAAILEPRPLRSIDPAPASPVLPTS